MLGGNTRRRDFLKSVGTAGVVGATMATAGCISSDDDVDRPVDGADELADEVEPIQFLAPTAGVNSSRNELAGMVAENWEHVGFEVDMEELEFDPHVQQGVVEQDFDASILGWGGTPERIDPHTFIYDMHHSSNGVEGGRNTPGYDNPDYDELAELQVTQYDEDERRETVFEAQRILSEDQPRTWVANEGGYHPYSSVRVSNATPTIGEGLNSFWNITSMEPTEDDTVRMGYPSEIISLNPMQDMATPDRQMVRLIYDRLFRITDEGTPTAWAAADDPVIEDGGQTITVEIRDGMTWHDGEDVTIDDVEFSFELFADSPTYGALLDSVEEIDTSGNEITFHLAEAFAPFTANVLAQVYLFPEHIWGDVDDPVDYEDEDYVGSGPFQFEDWERQSELQLSAFDDHFEPPNADYFIRVPGADESQLMGDLESGQIDFVGAVPEPNRVDEFDDDDDFGLAEFQDIGHLKIAYNTRREPFDQAHVRRALSYCVPKQDYVDLIRDGMGTVTHSTISEHVEAWHNPDVEQFTLDTDAAFHELADAGFGWDDSNRLHYGADQ